MRCPKEYFCKDTIFHIYNHAIGNENLFLDNKDYSFLLLKFEKILKEFPASIYAYCLMPNHFHFLVRQVGDEPVYKLFNRLFSGYVQYYNKKHKRKGRLLRSPLHHHLVDSDQYLIYLCQYIHLNPVKAGFVKDPCEWPYSNYADWLDIRRNGIFDPEMRNEYFSTPSEYQKSLMEFKDMGDDFSFLRLVFRMAEKQ